MNLLSIQQICWFIYQELNSQSTKTEYEVGRFFFFSIFQIIYLQVNNAGRGPAMYKVVTLQDEECPLLLVKLFSFFFVKSP